MRFASRSRNAVGGSRHSIGRWPVWLLTLLGVVCLAWIGLVDYWTGPHVALSLFYILPVAFVAWNGNGRAAIVVGCTAAVIWFLADLLTPVAGPPPAAPYWNLVIRLATLTFVIGLLLSLKEVQQRLRIAIQGSTDKWRREKNERARAEVALHQSEEQRSAIVEAAADAIITIDSRGFITEFNPAAERMFGYARANVVGRRMSEALIPASVDGASTKTSPLGIDLDEATPLGDRFRITAVRSNGVEFPIELTLRPLGLAGPPMFAVFIRDLTEQRKAEVALRTSEATVRLIAQNTTDLILAMDLEGQALYANPAIEPFPGNSSGAVPEFVYRGWVHPDDRHRLDQHRRDLYAGGSYANVTLRLQTRSGEIRCFSSTWGPLCDERGRRIGVQGREHDITELQRLEAEIIEISARERRQIDHELHDGLGQQLAGIAFRAKCLEETLQAESSSHAPDAARLVQLINQTVGHTRSIAHGLDPIQSRGNDLATALRTLASETQDLFGVDCRSVSEPELISLPPAIGTALYRIAQQAVTNAVQHGHARHIHIELRRDPDQISLQIQDDGVGFDPTAVRSGGMGLRIMDYRARLLGGSLVIQSEPQKGTKILCRLPAPRSEG